jgi:hypothetical protein
MSKTGKSEAKKCFYMEKQRLMDDIRKCDFCSTSWESHHRCLSAAAKSSGERSRACIMS